jgi:hypothetical protein
MGCGAVNKLIALQANLEYVRVNRYKKLEAI